MNWESLKDVVKRQEAGTPPPPWAGLFGGNPRPSECRLVLIPVPWDTTVSYGAGTAKGPEAIIGASHQLDLEDGFFGQPFRAGITMLPEDKEIASLNKSSRERAVRVIQNQEPHDALDKDLAAVNEASHRVNDRVYLLAREQLREGRVVGVVGGDHSSPYGLIKALAETHPEGFGVLHVDAHHDLRRAYEGFTHSHASIMFNVTNDIPAVKSLVQVAIRDYSSEESDYMKRLGARGAVHYSRELYRRQAQGESWKAIVQSILAPLPKDVYVSFDIDGLDPALCPSTGTPVPGGLSFEQAMFLIEEIVASGRRVIGFDLCEVAPDPKGDEWDANVGARVLYKLCGAAVAQ